ncbi:SusE domain-containing protein [Flammeovirga sp. SJP92]|uniref:SusE domain-containing protein n=1 Tax=Flammeovirga sp. SJP92 TaxID=1775430 RepID=UPI000794B1B1|nr:SusE domain-containing protein [Flammeovirga sp. SJP92]KXX71876.1 hypothetical protein AVL50_03580 [Flammeovirga sp. SJP92]
MRKALSILTILLAFFSCREKELTQTGNPDEYVSPEFTKVPDSEELYVFTEETSGDDFESLEWTAANFGAKSEYNYQILAAIEGYDQQEVVTLVNGSATHVDISQKEMNDAIMKITGALSEGMVTEENVKLSIRAFIGDAPTGSGVVASTKDATANILPFFKPTLPNNKMYVRGDHQDWTEGDDTTILGSEEEEGGPYTGYMYLNANFKVCAGPTWGDANYGQEGEWASEGNGFTTTMSTEGGDIKVTPAPGIFYMNTNGSSSLYIEPMTFKLKGSAIPNGEIVMDYDPTGRYLYANVDFVAGTYTFYGSEEHNFGMGEASGVAEIGGPAIEVTAGNKMVILDLKNPGTYIYYYQGAVEITAPVMTPLTVLDYVLVKENEDQNIETISWTEAVYGEVALDKYQVLLGSQVIYEGTELSTTLTVAELNAAALKNGGEAEVSGTHSVKVVALFVDNSKLESDAQELTITPYQAFAETLYVVGDVNDWGHNEEDVVNLQNPEGDYSNWFWMPAGGFKFTSVAGWGGTNYGYESDGVLSTDGGAGNIDVADANHYNVKMNPSTLTYELEVLEWGVIGDAVKGTGWDSEVPMTLDAGTQKWTIDIELVYGQFKFRANGNWDYNMGATDVDNEVDYDGANIQVEDAGNYTITLTYDNDTKKFSYTIEKK